MSLVGAESTTSIKFVSAAPNRCSTELKLSLIILASLLYSRAIKSINDIPGTACQMMGSLRPALVSNLPMGRLRSLRKFLLSLLLSLGALLFFVVLAS
jgi:hypothetical protein